ncbi:PspC family transcriptional regulator [Pedobacter yulinensis]|uniref:PspC family transcriptional regulator n=1 Tax=Pedobacter yulinensis TaxID=2126353 RepID=A0A2T3HPU3_9SPHI|nr:PspC domain-containing protein [Pedobacter yulinensis]PST84480.1 PspC family transcriptional regulator [Pedobacter yulinensis]
MENRLYRNEHNKMIAGVASGLADYMQVDITIVRLLFVLAGIFMFGTGLLVYIVMWVVIPVNNDPVARFTRFNEYFAKEQQKYNPFGAPPVNADPGATPGSAQPDWTSKTFSAEADFKVAPKNDTGRIVGGLFLLVLGCYFLLDQFDFIPYWFRLRKLWPLVFIAIGVIFIARSRRKNEWDKWKAANPEDTAATPGGFSAQAPGSDTTTSITATTDFTEGQAPGAADQQKPDHSTNL